MKILIANRGEIAVRIARSIRALGHSSIGLLPYGSHNALLLDTCDELIYFEPEHTELAQTYLSIENILLTAEHHAIDAIHPGYGFLSESAAFSRACAERNIIFIGPRPETLTLLGDKVASKKLATELAIPTIRGFEISETDNTEKIQERINTLSFPIIIKASYGGGGRGMRIIHAMSEWEDALRSARAEALRAFGNGAVFVEEYIYPARHIEVQICGDTHGGCIHLFERDCSLQRRHQKIVEIAPSTGLNDEVLDLLYSQSILLGKAAGLSNAATVEFLVDEKQEHYFIECNPRLQVEHTITEEITGVDIVALQIKTAFGTHLPSQDQIIKKGYAIQSRICAENPDESFAPATGFIEHLSLPAQVRVDNGYSEKEYITTEYDSLICKLISRGSTYEEALDMQLSSLNEFLIADVASNVSFLQSLFVHEKVITQKTHTRSIEEELLPLHFKKTEYIDETIVGHTSSFVSTLLLSSSKKNIPATPETLLIQIPQRSYEHVLSITPQLSSESYTPVTLHKIINHIPSFKSYILSCAGYYVHITTDISEGVFSHTYGEEENTLKAPLPCSILRVLVTPNESVKKDQVLIQYESMKTEYTLLSPRDGIVVNIYCREGDALNKEELFLSLG